MKFSVAMERVVAEEEDDERKELGHTSDLYCAHCGYVFRISKLWKIEKDFFFWCMFSVGENETALLKCARCPIPICYCSDLCQVCHRFMIGLHL